MFMLDWVHEHAVLDGDDVAMLPARPGSVGVLGRPSDGPAERPAASATFARSASCAPSSSGSVPAASGNHRRARAMARLMEPTA
jgi:hypothetical protein